MQFLYTFLLSLLSPLLLLRTLRKQKKSQTFLKFSQTGRWKERLAWYSFSPLSSKPIWIHAVSVGEFIAIRPLINDLLAKQASLDIVITCTTLTGSDQIQASYNKETRVHHVYLPWDLPVLMASFYRQFNPRIGLVMETEIWPNLLASANKIDCPIWLINARLSEKSANGYQRFSQFSQQVFNRFDQVCVQNKVDGQRFLDLGLESSKLIVTGSIKFDLVIDKSKLQQNKLQREVIAWEEKFIIVASSTHEGEESLILDSFNQIKKVFPHVVLILIPRHPERFSVVEQLIKTNYSELNYKKRSQLIEKFVPEQDGNTDLLIGDSMGEMMQYYHLSDLVIMGGSFINRGGHNLLEPAALAKAIIVGPHMFNFVQITQLFFEKQAIIQITNSQSLNLELTKKVSELLEQPEKLLELSSRAKKVMQEEGGVKEMLIQLLIKSAFLKAD